MIDLFRAEWQKATGHRWLTSFLIWIFPVGIGTFMAIVILVALLSPKDAGIMTNLRQGHWTADMIGIWSLLWSFPGNIFGRLPLLAFAGVLFAGEYEWGTWKNIVPHNRRAALVLTKFLALGVFVLVAFTITSLVYTVGHGVAITVAGGEFGPAISGETLAEFLGDYGLEMSLAFISTMIVMSYAALAALLTRSIISGLLVGFLLSVVEPVSLLLLFVVGGVLNQPGLVNLYQFAPSFNLDNVASWVRRGVVFNPGTETFTAEPGLAFSVALLAVWALGLIALTVYLFRRQDITT